MTAVIHQPDFLPYIGYFHRLLSADLLVVLDNVQYLRGSKSWHNRDKIRTSSGVGWLTVPTKKAPQKTDINTILISNDQNWRREHLSLLIHNYRKAMFFDEIFPYLERIYTGGEELLIDFTWKSVQVLMELFSIGIKWVFASETGASGSSNELLADILCKVGADTYLSGTGAQGYFKSEPFEQAGKKVIWQHFVHPEYPQQFTPFIPYLSAVDLLFNCGIDKSQEILRSI